MNEKKVMDEEKGIDTYIVLAGGYWHQARKPDMGGVQVDPKDKAKRTVDYVIKILGLPKDFVAPEETKRKFRFYCNTCQRWIKEIEVEQRVGCITDKNHDVRAEYRDVKVWSTSFDEYNPTRVKWMRPCHRVFVNTGKGLEKWRRIWQYVQANIPTNIRLMDYMPKAVGTKNQWELMDDDVPVIDLREALASYRPEIVKEDWKKTTFNRDKGEWKPQEMVKPAEEQKAKLDLIKCDVCGKLVERKDYAEHLKNVHKKE